MVVSRTKADIASWHRWMGLILSVPLLGWVVSSAALIIITYDLPNGLAGVYRLQPYNSIDIPLAQARLEPADILHKLSREYGIERVHWIRLESRGTHLLYVARPTPFSLAMTFDANSGQRLDPLPDALLGAIANESLVGSRLESLEDTSEFNRDYEIGRVPAVTARLAGEQPAELVLSRDSGRTLLRANGSTQSFHWWYKKLHVNQFSDHVIPWTALLYLCVLGALVVIVFGYLLFWWRRNRVIAPQPTANTSFSARNLHRKIGIVVGGVLAVQLVIGIYLWLSLGPLNDAFRGKESFASNWNAGIATSQTPTDPARVLERTAYALPQGDRPVQAIEWRKLLDREAWLITTRRDERPRVFDAVTGKEIKALHPMVAGEIARQEMIGNPAFEYLEPTHFASIDLNRRLPAYRFRFKDPQSTDIYVMQNTGEIVMRRPFFWRVFGPFLNTHMLAVTKNKAIDVTLLALFQISFLIVIITGWRLQFPGRRGMR